MKVPHKTQNRRDKTKPPCDGMIWSDKHGMWLDTDVRTIEQKVSDEQISENVKVNMMKYECHLTLRPEYRSKAEPIAANHGFTTSAIVGDEIMGSERLIYCTARAETFEAMSDKMNALTLALTSVDVKVIRRKIEHIVFDERL